MAGNDTRESIIRTGADLIALKGFGATGINAVLIAAAVPKGSFYHYFSSKNDFGLAVIDTYAADYDAKLSAIFQDRSSSPLQRLRTYFDRAYEDMTACDFSRGCLIGNLGQELAAQNELFRSRLDQVFARWEQRFADCIAEAQTAGEVDTQLDARQIAGFLLAGWEGAVLRAKVLRSIEPMQRFEQVLFERVLGSR